MLHAAGLDAAAVRRAVTTAMAGFAQARLSAPTDGQAALAEIVRRLDALETRLGAAGL